MKEKKNIIIIGIFVLLLIVLMVMFLSKNYSINNNIDSLSNEKITIAEERGEFTVWRNGDTEFVDKNGNVIRSKWTADKTDAFFSYYFNNFIDAGILHGSGGSTITISSTEGTYTYNGDDDELSDIVIDEETGDGGGESGGDDISDYFGDPTPTPSGIRPTATPRIPTPTPSSPFENCLYWRLSYCVIPKPSPTPEPTAAPGEGVIDVSNCDEWNESQTTNTVINNTVCIPLE